MMIQELLAGIVTDLQSAFATEQRVKVSNSALSLNRKISDADASIYLDVVPASLETQIVGRETSQNTAGIDLRIASRVKSENDIASLITFTDNLQRRLSKGWRVAGFTLESLQWQGIDRIANTSDVFITYLSFSFTKALYR